MARKPLNPRSYRYAVSAAHLGVSSVAEMTLCLETPGVSHEHGEFQVLWLLKGSMRLTLGHGQWEAASGALCLIRPGEAHHVQTPVEHPTLEYIDLRVVATPPTVLGNYLAGLAARSPVHALDADAVREAAGALHELARVHEHIPDARLMAAIWRLLALAESDPAPAAKAAADPFADLPDPRLRFAEAVMREQLPWAPSVAKVAARTNISVSQLTRLYRQHAGITPAARMRQLRLEKATELVVGSTLSIKQIADTCGFENPRHFSRLFRETTGQTPREYRQMMLTRSGAAGMPDRAEQ